MAIAHTNIANGTINSSSNTTSYTSVSAGQPTAGAHLLAWVVASGTVAAAPTFSGYGATWTLTDKVAFNGGADTLYFFEAEAGASPSSTQITFDCTGDAATGCSARAQEVTAAIPTRVQLVKSAANQTSANPTVTMAALSNTSDNLVVFCFGESGVAAPIGTPGTNYAEKLDQSYSTPTTGIYIESGLAISDNTPDVTAATTLWAGIAVEFGPAVNASATPSVVAAVSAVPAPTVKGTAVATPSAVAGVAAVPAPTVLAAAVVSPSTVTGVGAVPAPTVVIGGGDTTATPAAVAGVSAVPAPTVLAEAIATPAAVAGVSAVPAPTVKGTAVVSPSTVAAIAAVPTPSLSAAAKPTPSVVAGVATVPAPSVLAAAVATPSAVAAIVAVPSPSVLAAAVASPGVVAAIAAVLDPTIVIQADATATPDTVAVIVVVVSPTVLVTVVVPTPIPRRQQPEMARERERLGLTTGYR